MVQSFARLGTDIRLLHNLIEQNSRNPGSDLSRITRPATGQVDLETLSAVENLQQALLLRFLTPLGELTPLGHPDYGSRLFELIGQLNTESNRNLAKMFVLQSLAAEPRVQQVLSVKVTQNPARREEMDIELHLQPVDSNSALNLVFPFFLE